jgi:hypothetical protein
MLEVSEQNFKRMIWIKDFQTLDFQSNPFNLLNI